MTSRRAFTLVELMVVIGIMGLLGTISVGGYRAIRRSEEERGVMRNVNYFIRAAYERAQIDRQPTAIFFWNETLRESTADDNEVVVGKAVAVRRAGRITEKSGSVLCDEFADLEKCYPTTKPPGGEIKMYLYPVDNLSESSGNIPRTEVEVYVKKADSITPEYCSEIVNNPRYWPEGTREKYEEKYEDGSGGDEEDGNKLYRLGPNAKKVKGSGEGKSLENCIYGFIMSGGSGVSWSTGMAYGFEFANIELPHGYIFKSNYSKSLSNPIEGAGTMSFNVGVGGGNTIEICALRPDSSGNLRAESVGKSVSPTKQKTE